MSKPSRRDVALSSGRTIAHRWDADDDRFVAYPTSGPATMTDAEWAEYTRILRYRIATAYSGACSY